MLVVRIARNHPLPDGNKRLAWQALTVFLALNGHRLEVAPDDAVALMLASQRAITTKRRSWPGSVNMSTHPPLNDQVPMSRQPGAGGELSNA